jgi:hypothetical protein
MDALTIVVVVFTSYAKVGGWSDLGRFPWWIMMVGAGILFARMTLLMVLNGTGYQIVSNVANFVGRSITDNPDFRFQWSAAPQPLSERKGGPLDKPTFTWFFLIVIGILAMVTIVGSSGGITSSPFWEILLATFIIGQFRVPTGMGIWALFWFGIPASAAAQVMYQLLSSADRRPFAMMHFKTAYYVAPLLLVLFISTLVSYVTFSTEPNSPTIVANVVDDAPATPAPPLDLPSDPEAEPS